jgi:hypothetical protein
MLLLNPPRQQGENTELLQRKNQTTGQGRGVLGVGEMGTTSVGIHEDEVPMMDGEVVIDAYGEVTRYVHTEPACPSSATQPPLNGAHTSSARAQAYGSMEGIPEVYRRWCWVLTRRASAANRFDAMKSNLGAVYRACGSSHR